MKRVRFGIIGGGMMGRLAAATIRRWPELLVDLGVQPELTAVASRSAKSLAWFDQSAFAGVQRTTDYRELLRNDAVDVVYAAVPHYLHEEVFTATLQAGKHLFGEKPFGMDLQQNERLIAATAKHPDLFVRCVSQWAYFPGFQKLVQAARADAFGRIIDVAADYLHASDMDPQKPGSWKRQSQYNGQYGVMGDLGPHVMFILQRLGIAPTSVAATLTDLIPTRPDGKGGTMRTDTWDNAHLHCTARAGAGDASFPLTMRLMRICPGETDTLAVRVLGTKRSMRFSLAHARRVGSLDYDRTKPQAWLNDDVGYAANYKTIHGAIAEFGMGDAMLQMFAAFLHEFAGGAADVPFGCMRVEETHVAHQLFEAALASHQRQTVERIAS